MKEAVEETWPYLCCMPRLQLLQSWLSKRLIMRRDPPLNEWTKAFVGGGWKNSVKVGEQLEGVSWLSVIGSAHLVRSIPSAHPFFRVL